jgi:hypothetical protein
VDLAARSALRGETSGFAFRLLPDRVTVPLMSTADRSLRLSTACILPERRLRMIGNRKFLPAVVATMRGKACRKRRQVAFLLPISKFCRLEGEVPLHGYGGRRSTSNGGLHSTLPTGGGQAARTDECSVKFAQSHLERV